METEYILCDLCPHNCRLYPGQSGRCHVRENRDGQNVSRGYGKLTSIALDPIEKKPLARFYPGYNILSVGGFGCNLTCPFCQNHSISMSDGNDLPLREASPEELVELAESLIPQGNIGIAFTYNEPLINFEYVRDTFKLAKERGLKTVLVTNGNINPERFSEIAELTDAFNIDLKGLSIYDKISGDIKTVEENIKRAAEKGAHVEVTTLVIPGENDTDEEIDEISSYLAAIDPEIVLHVTRFFPQFKMMDRPPTPVETIYRLTDRARSNLKHVYPGNV